jgi:hypothetical protein
MCDYTLDLISLDEDSLEAIGRHSTCREVEHITSTEEILCSYLIEDSTRVYIGCHGKCYSRWYIGLDETRDDIY